LNLEELVQAKAYEFVAVVPPLRVRGGTGSALRVIALVPRKDRDQKSAGGAPLRPFTSRAY
jgi:hypothetical protein